MRRILGATCVSCLVGMVGVGAAALGGYSVMSGKTLCSMMTCPESAKSAKSTKEAVVVNASNKEGEAKKDGCCALSGLAKKSACTGEAQVVQASAKEGGCASAKAKCMASKAQVGDIVTVAGAFPVVMPAMFYNPAVQVNEKDLSSAGCGGEAKASCHGAEGKVVEAKAASSGCCKSGEAKVVQAKAGAADAGCCKGSGQRADGQPCKKDGDHCTKEAAKQAESKPEAPKAGEPVASRN